jgi:PilZ domain
VIQALLRDSAPRGAAWSSARGVERRSKTRYPVQLNAHYQILTRSGPIGGTGRTLDISSGGILIASQASVDPGARIQVNLEWPTHLEGDVHLQLVARGNVTRRDKLGFAVAFDRYEFKTMKREPAANRRPPAGS